MATAAEARELLERGPLKVLGRLVDSSNSALVVTASGGDAELVAVYKPLAGERPLWDFPYETLAHREVATYDLSQALGWDLVPLTVWRDDGPAGPGMCQCWIETDDPSGFISVFPLAEVPAGWHRILQGVGTDHEPLAVAHSDAAVLRQMAVLDVITNNADRKVGHILVDDGQLVGIDHGVTFNIEPKLRTVLWGFSGKKLGSELCETVERFVKDFDAHAPVLAAHLDADEIKVTRARARALLAAGKFPQPPTDGPAIPWPII